MSIVVSIQVDPRALSEKLSSGPEPPDEAERATADNFSRVTTAYAKLYTRYEFALAQSLDLANLDDPQIHQSSIPEITVPFEDGEATSVVFDVDLLTSLIEIYALRGWSGITRVEALLGERRTEAETTSTSGGTALSGWSTVVPFFKATRNLLASLVRDALADIERQARARIESRLRAADKAFEKVWNSDLRMTVVKKTTYEGGVDVIKNYFVFGNRALADDLFVDLTHAVKARAALDAKLKEARGEAERLAARQSEYERTRQNQGAPGYRSPYGEDSTQENIDTRKKEQSSLEAQLRDLTTSIENGIFHNCPVALLVFDGLRPGFSESDMEHAIGDALDSLRMRIRKLLLGLAKSENQVPLRFPDDPTKALGDFGKASALGVELTMLDEMLLRADDAAVVPLLSEDTWHDLVNTDVIQKGSFGYFVYYHYVTELMVRREHAAVKEAAAGNLLNKSLALVSLSVLAVPVLAPFEIALGLFVFCHGIHEASRQLTRIDKAVDQLLTQSGESAMPVMARVGELETIRKEMIQTIAREFVLGLVLSVAGQRWLLTKRLLLGYGYYTDLTTLFGGLDGAPQT